MVDQIYSWFSVGDIITFVVIFIALAIIFDWLKIKWKELASNRQTRTLTQPNNLKLVKNLSKKEESVFKQAQEIIDGINERGY